MILWALTRFPNNSTHGALYETLNCGKQDIVINLKHNDAAQIIQRIIPKFDVLIEGNRPGVMEKLGMETIILSNINLFKLLCV